MTDFSEITTQLQNKTILITGVAGFLGSHLAEAAFKAGAKVIGVDNFITGQPRNLDEVTAALGEQCVPGKNWWLVTADASQSPATYLSPELLIAIGRIDIVLHFASPASPPRYQAKPVETYLVNSQGTHELLQWLKLNYPSATFLFASTSEIYGDPEVHPQPESYWGHVNPNGIRSCYDEAKRLGETICGVHERDFGMDVRIARIFNTYGPRLDLKDGRVIPNFISQALLGQPLTIYGDGSQTRSYCYVADLVQGILLLATRPGLKGTTVNLGNPEEYSLLETAKQVFEIVTGQSFTPDQIKYQSLPGDDPTRRQPDIHLAAELLNWQPAVGFAEGIQKTAAYFRLLSPNPTV